ncbi:MAG: hypothetical protein PWR31_1287 [Bacillota bacterium]|nr:hypothetical protein [Bacillota bacterium]BCV23422.1 hypothetical protein kuro4_01950 [Gelria sp. Kuro-4]
MRGEKRHLLFTEGHAARGEPGRGGAAVEVHIGPLDIVIAPLVALVLLRYILANIRKKK